MDADALLKSALVGGDEREYASLYGRIANPRLSAAEARTLLCAFAKAASTFHEDVHTDLLTAALRVRWTEDAGVAEAYALLAQELIARSTVYVEPFLSAVVDAFASTGAALSEEVSDVAHAMLRSVLFSCPLAARALCDLIHARFPHRRLGVSVHVSYLRHVLRIMSYERYVQPILVPHIIQQLLAIDAEAVVPKLAPAQPAAADDADADVDADADDDDTVFKMDDMFTQRAPQRGAQAGGGGGGAALEPEADKLDKLLALFFEFWSHALGGSRGRARADGGGGGAAADGAGDGGVAVWAAAGGKGGGGAHGEMLIYGLLSAFDAFIVRAQCVQCVQFALLVGTSLSREHAHALLSYLGKKLSHEGRDEPFALKQACVAYAVSYTASAAFLDTATVVSALEMLLAHARALARALAGGDGGAHPGAAAQQPQPSAQAVGAQHRLFLATTAGCCLVLERRWAQLRAGAVGAAEDSAAPLGQLRLLLDQDCHNVLSSLGQSTLAFTCLHIASESAALVGAALDGHAAAQCAAAANQQLPFESYALPESGRFVRPLLLAPPAVGAAPRRATGAASAAALRAGAGAGLLGASVSPADSCGAHSIHSGGNSVYSGGAQPRSLHDGGSVRLPVSLGQSTPQLHGGLLSGRLQASPLTRVATSPSHAVLRPLPGLALSGSYLGGGASLAIPMAQPHYLAVAADAPGPTALAHGRGSLADCHSLADSFPNNCSMSFSPDDLEAHIRTRFEECKRTVAVAGESPTDSPLLTYNGFDGAPRLAMYP